MNKKIAVLGAGSWGTALALYLARQNDQVFLWHKDADTANIMQQSRINQRYLPQFVLPKNIDCGSNLAQACHQAEAVLIAAPSFAFRAILTAIKPLLTAEQWLIWACKGLDPTTNRLLDDVTCEILSEHVKTAVLSGPNFASEIAAGLPAATTLACRDANLLPDLLALFKSAQLRVYTTTDVIGVEICGVLKNVIAIAVGISDGLALGANARAALITRGLAEITRLALVLGAKLETMLGMAGMGDLILTCTDDKSRNRRFGKLLGQGIDVAAALKEIGQVVEGYANVEQARLLAQRYQTEMPITEQVYQICYQGVKPQQAAQSLMQR